MHPDEQYAIEATTLGEVGGTLYTQAEYREMFLGAIKIQEEVKEQADRMIAHYQYALSELAKQEIVN